MYMTKGIKKSAFDTITGIMSLNESEVKDLPQIFKVDDKAIIRAHADVEVNRVMIDLLDENDNAIFTLSFDWGDWQNIIERTRWPSLKEMQSPEAGKFEKWFKNLSSKEKKKFLKEHKQEDEFWSVPREVDLFTKRVAKHGKQRVICVPKEDADSFPPGTKVIVKKVVPPAKVLFQEVERASGLIETVCEHGVGHPTYESAKKVAEKHGHDINTWLIHGCDGCCSKPGFPGRKVE